MPDGQLIGDDVEGMTGMTGMMGMEMMGMMRSAPMYTGTMYRSSMPSKKLVMTEVGLGTVLFKDRNHAVFAYTVGNVSGAKDVTRMVFDAAAPSCTLGGAKGAAENYSDLWFNPADTGWGLNLVQQGDTVLHLFHVRRARQGRVAGDSRCEEVGCLGVFRHARARARPRLRRGLGLVEGERHAGRRGYLLVPVARARKLPECARR